MRIALVCGLSMLLLPVAPALAQQPDVAALRQEIALLKARLAQIEATLDKVEEATARDPRSAAPVGSISPALNTPPRLPASRADAFVKTPPRVDVLIQARATAFRDEAKTDTFRLRKAELGIKGHIAPRADFSLELDPVRPDDPFRRTYLRLVAHDRLHIKAGLEKAPIGLEELLPTAQIPFVDRSEVSDRFAAAEELGIHLESRWPRWQFQFAVTNGGRRLLLDDNSNKALTTRVVWAPEGWLSLGSGIMVGDTGRDARPRDRYNAELKIGSNLTGAQAEFFRARDGAVWSSAYYASAYWLARAAADGFGVQPALRYEQIDRGDRNRAQERRLVTFGVNLLLPGHQSKLQVNYLKDLHTAGVNDELRAQYQVEF